MKKNERPLTVTEAAERLGLSVYTVRSWIWQRRLGCIRLGRAVRVPATEIERVLRRGAIPATRECDEAGRTTNQPVARET